MHQDRGIGEPPARGCDGCDGCCFPMAIYVEDGQGQPVVWKERGARCRHLLPQGGCGAYEQRPPPCRAFLCAYMAGIPNVPHPLDCGVMVYPDVDAGCIHAVEIREGGFSRPESVALLRYMDTVATYMQLEHGVLAIPHVLAVASQEEATALLEAELAELVALEAQGDIQPMQLPPVVDDAPVPEWLQAACPYCGDDCSLTSDGIVCLDCGARGHLPEGGAQHQDSIVWEEPP